MGPWVNDVLTLKEEVCHRRGKELAEARRAVAIFLENNRFDPSNTNSKRGWMVTYPLHEAPCPNGATHSGWMILV